MYIIVPGWSVGDGADFDGDGDPGPDRRAARNDDAALLSELMLALCTPRKMLSLPRARPPDCFDKLIGNNHR
jgi:hypothetical protein